MKFPVTNRWSGKAQIEAEIDCSDDAPVRLKLGLAVKWAVRTGANLRGADLRGAYLRSADLSGAYLWSAYLWSADLMSARGIAPEACTPLLMLLDQPGPLRAYKLIDSNRQGPFNGGITYEIGQSYEVKNADCDPTNHCAAGINVATLDWCLKEWREGYRILIIEFDTADIACIPTATDGKFRLKRCRVIAEKAIDPVALGLVKPADAEAA